jgi:hypothetical protein
MLSTDFAVFVFTDAGKSTIGGQIMNLTGMVDKRTLEKYEREAKEKSRETWYLSWALDTNQEGETTEKDILPIGFCFNPVILPFIQPKCSLPCSQNHTA